MAHTGKPTGRDATHSARDAVDDGEREVPLSIARRDALGDPTLASMIKKGVPLTRNAYLMMSYGPELPGADHWNAEHEMGLPACFQKPLNRPRHARKPE